MEDMAKKWHHPYKRMITLLKITIARPAPNHTLHETTPCCRDVTTTFVYIPPILVIIIVLSSLYNKFKFCNFDHVSVLQFVDPAQINESK